MPLVMLLAGVSTVFLFSGDRDYFYRQNWISSHQLAIASNLSPATNFMQYDSKILDGFGNFSYALYGRFPLGGYALIKLVTFAFDNNMSTQIYAARILMLVFFVGTVLLAYWTLCRLTSNRWVALSATAIAFSSGYFLYYNDLISTEFGIDLFGCMLVFHGMTIFALESRFRQLVVKSCIALLLGWHVLAVLMPFVVLGVLKEFFSTGSVSVKNCGGIFRYFLAKIRVGVAAVITSRYIILGIIVVGFALLVLISNIGSQYYHHNIENDFNTELSDLPVLQSATVRLGGAAESEVALRVEWLPFLRDQFVKIGLMSAPFALPGYSSAPSWWEGNGIVGVSELQNLLIGIVVVGICLIGGFLAPYRLLTMTAVVSGFCWAIPFRYNVAFHHWEALYYVGLPLVIYAMIFTLVRKLSNELFIGLSSAIIVLIFSFSSFQMSSVRDNSGLSADLHRTLVDDFNVIRRLIEDRSVLIPVLTPLVEESEEFNGFFHYLSGSTLVFDKPWCNVANIDYEYNVDFVPDEVDLIIQNRRDMPGLLTPNNQMMYLYDQYVFEREISGFIEDNEPFYSYGFDIYLTGDRMLLYIADRCGTSGRLLDSQFFLEITPVSVDDLPADRKPYGYDRLDFYFDEYEVLDTKRFILALRLPDYDIDSIRAGQLTDDGDLIWENMMLGSDYAIAG